MKKLTKVEKLKQELKLAMNIEKRNKDFKKLSKAGKRVAIVKDVIDSLKAKKYFAKKSIYLEINEKDYGIVNQEVLCSDNTVCTVCALGGIFASKVKIANEFSNDLELTHDGDMRKNLSKYFTEYQLHLIEAAFEGWEKGNVSTWKLKNNDHMKYIRSYSNPNDRMIVIMENIIENKGTFKP